MHFEERVYVYELPDWPAFRWDEDVLEPLLKQVRHKQGRLLGSMGMMGFDLRGEAAAQSLSEELVRSCAIEGERVNDQEVRSSMARHLGLDATGLPKPSREVDGLVEMMLDATRNYADELTSARLFDWHGALISEEKARLNRLHRGTLRDDRFGVMQVVSGRPNNQRVHFEAPKAECLEAEVARFLEWFNAESGEDPVLKAGLAHFWFVTLHPFDDGNGRLARAVAEMALARADQSGERFYSMSSQIADQREDYYRILETSQSASLDVTAWLVWFLRCYDRTLDAAEVAHQGLRFKARFWLLMNRFSVKERQRMMLKKMLGDWEGFLNSSKYAKLMKCSTDTALRDILALVEIGVLVKNSGGGRSTSYRLLNFEALEELDSRR